jgi:hypothetical protein
MQRVLGEHAADMVIGVEELSAEFTLVDAEALNTVVVYGSDISAFTALGCAHAEPSACMLQHACCIAVPGISQRYFTQWMCWHR